MILVRARLGLWIAWVQNPIFLACTSWKMFSGWSFGRFKMTLPYSGWAPKRWVWESGDQKTTDTSQQAAWQEERGVKQQQDLCRGALSAIRDCISLQVCSHCLWNIIPYWILKPLLQTVDVRENYLKGSYKEKRTDFFLEIPGDMRRCKARRWWLGRARLDGHKECTSRRRVQGGESLPLEVSRA